MKKMLTIVMIFLMVIMSSSCAKREEDIINNCPFGISENAVIEQYPSNNLLGLTAIIEEEKGESNNIILVFDNLGEKLNADYDDYARISGTGRKNSKRINSFHFDEIEMKYSDNNLYVSLMYDKNIEPEWVDFPIERVFLEEIGVARYTYGLDKSGNPQVRTDYQSFDYSNLKWSKVSKEYMSLLDEPQ